MFKPTNIREIYFFIFFLIGCLWQNGKQGWGGKGKMGIWVSWSTGEKQTASAGVWLESPGNLVATNCLLLNHEGTLCTASIQWCKQWFIDRVGAQRSYEKFLVDFWFLSKLWPNSRETMRLGFPVNCCRHAENEINQKKLEKSWILNFRVFLFSLGCPHFWRTAHNSSFQES